MTRPKRVVSDQNGGYNVNVQRKEIWTKLVPAAAVLMTGAGFGIQAVVEDIHELIVEAPLVEHRIEVLEARANATDEILLELQGAVVRLTAVLEDIEANHLNPTEDDS